VNIFEYFIHVLLSFIIKAILCASVSTQHKPTGARLGRCRVATAAEVPQARLMEAVEAREDAARGAG